MLLFALLIELPVSWNTSLNEVGSNLFDEEKLLQLSYNQSHSDKYMEIFDILDKKNI